MPAPLSDDLRKRMLKSMNEEGLSCKATARRYGVAASTAIRLKKHEEKYRTHKPLKFGGHMRHKLSEHHDKILFVLSETPDMTISELQHHLNSIGISVGYGGVFRYLKHIGLTFKKRHYLHLSKTDRKSSTGANNGGNTRTE